MTSIIGNPAARAAFEQALAGGTLHHCWLFGGPEGVGKASMAIELAAAVLAEGRRGFAGELAEREAIAARIAREVEPDLIVLRRDVQDKGTNKGKLKRAIDIDQIRAMLARLTTRPAYGERRVILVDAIDDLERSAANAMLKALEEPPAGTMFLLISHAPGRLLPTIRSRCRVLRFEPLSDAEVAEVVRRHAPELGEAEVAALVRVSQGAPGRALGFAGLDLAPLEQDLATIAATGDPDNAIRNRLAKALGGKPAQERYEAFMALAPAMIAASARERRGDALVRAIECWEAARALEGAALGLSLDAGASVFEMATLVARLAPVGRTLQSA